MFSPYALEALAREKRLSALSDANHERLLRETRRPSTGNWEMFNHYHFWPADSAHARQPAAFSDEGRIARREPGLLEQIAHFLFRRAETEFSRRAETIEGPRVAALKRS